MKEELDYLEQQYGIKKNNNYVINYTRSNTGSYEFIIKGNISNFNGKQVFLISEDGLHIISVKNITQMYPVKERI